VSLWISESIYRHHHHNHHHHPHHDLRSSKVLELVEATFHQDLELYYEFTSITGTILKQFSNVLELIVTLS
jgi:hypothetical protein